MRYVLMIVVLIVVGYVAIQAVSGIVQVRNQRQAVIEAALK